MRTERALVVLAAAAALTLAAAAALADDGRNFAGSVQLDYLAVPTERVAREQALDGATVELSLKLTQDFGHDVTSSVKVCVACHGLEVGMAYFDLRFSDEASVRVGRFTPAFGSFPLRHDPANHRTSDKPLPYDMGRMLHLRDWGEGILPAPWIDNGIELSGTHFLDHGQLDYAIYAVSGPKGPADGLDFDYTLSRSGERYYVDNNSQPSVGARLGGSLEGDQTAVTVGASAMAGHYDPDARLGFLIAGADVVFRRGRGFLRGEYLARWTQLSLGDDPAGRFKYGPGADGSYADFSRRDGFYLEAELPAGPLELIARWDGLRRRGNVATTSLLRSDSIVLRYTAGAAIRIRGGLRLKTSVELYDFSDFDDEVALHLGIAGPF